MNNVKLIKEFSLAGNGEFWLEEVEADGREWICISSHGLDSAHFFQFWSKPEGAQAMAESDIVDELSRRLRDIHDEADRTVLRKLIKFDTPGWDQWTFGTPASLGDYLYG